MFFSKKNKPEKLRKSISDNPNIEFSISEAFPDQNLAQIIADQLGVRPKDKITLSQLNNIQTINASNSNISNLEGIEFLNNLKTANFSNNNITQLPDYTLNNPQLYKNKNSIILFDLSNNPFLNPNNLFSLDNTEARRKFIGQFTDSYNRFKLGNVKDQLYVETQTNPELIRHTINALLSRGIEGNRDDLINDIFIKYIIGKNLFYNQKIYQNDYIINEGKLNFRKELIAPDYLNNENEQIIAQLIEEIIPESDLYLIRSIIKNTTPLNKINSTSIEDYINYYQSHPEEISTEYIFDNTGWKEKSNYRDLKNAALSTEEELMLKSIANPIIQSEYNKYLQIKDVLELYQTEHPEKVREVSKIINKFEKQINDFLTQYINLEKNALLTDEQKNTLKQAEKSIQTFNQNYKNQATDLFEQDVFGLEVEMKYIDMLAQADKKIG